MPHGARALTRCLAVGRAGDVEMAAVGRKPTGEGESLIKPGADRMRRPSARSFLDYQDESGSDSDDSFGALSCAPFKVLSAGQHQDPTLLMAWGLTGNCPCSRPFMVSNATVGLRVAGHACRGSCVSVVVEPCCAVDCLQTMCFTA